MVRPRTPRQALRRGLAVTLTILLGACQQLEDSRSTTETPVPQPVVVAPEPVVEAPVAVAVPPKPSPSRPTAPKPGLSVVIGGGATQSGNIGLSRPTDAGGVVVSNSSTAGKSTTQSSNVAKIGTPSSREIEIGAASPSGSATEAPPSESSQGASAETSAVDAEAGQEAPDQLAASQETQASQAPDDVEVAAGEPAAPIPQFPWPPPRASASAAIPAAFVKPDDVDVATLGDVAAKISAALDTGGYFERSYFGAPGGFAMVTRLERINPDGTSADEAQRWTVGDLPLTSFSLSEYLRALFTAPSGRYRIIVFVASSQPFAQSQTEVGRSEALAWLAEGLNRLPDNIALAPFTPQHKVTALIYEFEQPGNQEAMLMLPANLMGRVHLERAQLWDALRQ